ncbi:unnamed protein product, partial [Tenebrio molitor]
LSKGNVHFIFLQICTVLCMMMERYVKWPNIFNCEQQADEILARTNFPGVIAVRSCVERAFGLLKNKFRRLRYLDMSLLEEIPTVITACCVLHNFIIIHEGYDEDEVVIDDLDDVPLLQDDQPI